ncbi:Methyltransf-25 domain-containing protein [Mycena kentingensis (nom. inval.)]|nr:Methyltransf-25 domain-containing protein [Mycena kentingensis (nom. inval.)]
MVKKAEASQFPDCFTIAAEMKAQGVPPSRATYNTLLRSLAHGGYASATLAVLEDMLALHIQPDTNSFNFIIQAHRTERSPSVHAVLQRMQQLEVVPNSATYTHLITRFASENNLEECLKYLNEMTVAGLVPQLAAIQAVIVLAAKQEYPKLAIELAVSYEKSTRKVQDFVWTACLHASAAQLYAEGVLKTWHILVQNLAISPDEGLCLLVLHTAARHGLAELATDVLRVLKLLDIPIAEHHLAPMFESLFVADRHEEAFQALEIMRKSGAVPSLRTAYCVVAAVSERPHLLDELWTLVKRMHAEGKHVDPTVCTALIQASVSSQPLLSRVLAEYQSIPSLGIEADAECLAVFLDACIADSNVSYGELVFRQADRVAPVEDANILGKMVALHTTQDNFDEACRYLEMLGMVKGAAGLQVYEDLALKMAAARDARYLFIIDAARRARHDIRIRPDFVERCTAYYRGQVKEPRPPPRKVGLDPAVQKFIETGGLLGEKV